MKYLKMLGLAMLAAAALMSIIGAGSASATELTCSAGVMCPAETVLHGSSEGHVILDAPIGNIDCQGSLEGKTSNTGGPSETVSGMRTSFTINNCTNATIQVLRIGTTEVHTDPNDSTGTSGNGTVTSTGTEGTVEFAGFHCIFATKETDLGTLTGSSTTKSTATFDISGTIPRTGGRSGVFCGQSAQITGSGTVDTPDFLDVH
ncbi:MAG TPA: hypothetical protein VFX44_10500 [Solirubrobacterales bacterium]|nr:hypothetical protein [Solirubrobacterales bacterium]